MTDSELISELERLSLAYGTGLIKLNINNPDESIILSDAKTNDTLEWDFINYFYELNSDYRSFIDSLVDIMKIVTVYKEKFDKIESQVEILKYGESLKSSK